MATHLPSYGELTAMPREDLRKDIVAQRALIRKMKLAVLLNKEKDTAKLRRERRQLARMLTAWTAQPSVPVAPAVVKKSAVKATKDLKKKPKNTRVAAPAKP
ncbi:MAG: hypothetical protein WCS85_01645 [Candidatus Peribacteraceae bacterium]|jgi:hypothetical protein